MRLSDVLFAYSMCRAPSSNTSPGRRKGSCNLNGISKAGGNIHVAGFGLGAWARTGVHMPGSLAGASVCFSGMPHCPFSFLKILCLKIHSKQENRNRPTELDLQYSRFAENCH